MRKIFYIGFLCLVAHSAQACEFCGCSSGNYFIGPFPQFRNYFVGTRYTFRSFSTTLASDPSQFSKDFYQTVEVWGGVNLGRRWQVLGFLPYNINRQESDDGVKVTNALGDATVIANYNIFKSLNETGSGQSLWIGGGVKVPTGKYNIDPDDPNASASNQPGTGSVDFVASAMYSVYLDEWSLNASATYRLNQEANEFQFGDRMATSLFVYRSFTTLPATFKPTTGLLYENLGLNKHEGMDIQGTGGHGLLGAVGLDTNLRKITVGFNVQLPLAQNYSAGQTDVKLRGMVHLTWAF